MVVANYGPSDILRMALQKHTPDKVVEVLSRLATQTTVSEAILEDDWAFIQVMKDLEDAKHLFPKNIVAIFKLSDLDFIAEIRHAALGIFFDKLGADVKTIRGESNSYMFIDLKNKQAQLALEHIQRDINLNGKKYQQVISYMEEKNYEAAEKLATELANSEAFKNVSSQTRKLWLRPVLISAAIIWIASKYFW